MSDGGGIAPAVWKTSSSSVSLDFCDQKTYRQFFFSIFINIMQKKIFLIFLVKFQVVLVAGAIKPPLSNAQFSIPSVIVLNCVMNGAIKKVFP